MKKESIYILEDRGIIYINGDDVFNYLQNIISNDLNKVLDNHSCFSYLLTPQGKFLFDLRSIVNYKLKKVGVKEIDNINLDTFKDSKNFFSHRRSKQLKEPDYGRCLSVITL